jgi:hypothetical protein
MPTLILKPRPPRRPSAQPLLNPLYGYGYNPAWPSVLSVAHDESNGGRLFVCVDRPCLLAGPVTALPLSVAGLTVLEAVQINAIRFRLWMSGAVPRGAAWAWGPNGTGIVDPVTFHCPNGGAGGDCTDVPGAFVPVAPANVVSAASFGTSASLTFDKPIISVPGGGTVDGTITFNGLTPDSLAATGGSTVTFNLPSFVNPGDPWAISGQPAWAATPIAVPQSGNL